MLFLVFLYVVHFRIKSRYFKVLFNKAKVAVCDYMEKRFVMESKKYLKGNMMTFPLELTETGKEEMILDNKYLYPPEIKDIQMEIEEVCDRMEYDGSIMFDECPDKITVERIVKKMCSKNNYGNCCAEGDRKWFTALIQVMLCNEMGYRRNRRMCHKDRMFSK